MPKEVIYADDGHLPYGTPEDPGPARSVVELTWSREAEHVQLVTKCVEATSGETYRPPLEATEVPHGSNMVEVVDLPEPRFQDGFYVTLNRDGINRLIRNLRRARDQAYGRDE